MALLRSFYVADDIWRFACCVLNYTWTDCDQPFAGTPPLFEA